MHITDELLDKMARLARLHIAPEERASMREDFQQMLNFVDKLQEVDTEGVAPLVYMTDDRTNRWEEDAAQPPLGNELVTKHAPDASNHAFRVPRIR
ncbi:MAG: Asp-tRNA(Asn)/Glu-tRNA(Gln) amidotransferase subunit GatC [Bacteroidia bacterium]